MWKFFLLILVALVTALVAWAVVGDSHPGVAVGSKKFTESVILADMTKDLIEDAGFPTVHRAELGGTRFLWDALLAGSIDVYPEYTGTIREEIFSG
jgi:osmoprotectant transport system permease protein